MRLGTPLRARHGVPAILALCMLIIVVLFAAYAIRDRGQARRNAEIDLVQTVRTYQEHAHATFETFQVVARLIGDYVSQRSWDSLAGSRTAAPYLGRLITDYPVIRSIALIDASGTPRAGSLPHLWSLPNFADTRFFVRLRDGGETEAVGRRVRLPGDDVDVIAFARRLTTPEGMFAGAVAIFTTAETFEQFWGQGSPALHTALFRADGSLLARYPEAGPGAAEIRAGAQSMRMFQAGAIGIYETVSPLDGDLRLRAVAPVPGFPLFISNSMSVQDLLTNWRTQIARDASLLAVSLAALVAIGVVALRHARREDEARASLARQTDRLRRAEQDLATVLRDTVDRQEAERKRVALELHDSLGQHVAVLHFGLDKLRADCDRETATHGRIEGLKKTATALSYEISRLASELRPLGIDELGLDNAIRSHARAIAERTGLRFDLHLPNLPAGLPPSVEDTLFRAMQEAVSNVIRHAAATRVSIVLEHHDGTIRLIVEDNGKGFEWPATHDDNGRRPLGLLGMRERLALVGGKVVVETRAGGGTTIFISIPLSETGDVEQIGSRASGG